jgi:hypothetical protein
MASIWKSTSWSKLVLAGWIGLLALAPFSLGAGPLSDRVEAVVVKGKSLPAAMLEGSIPSYRLFASDGSALKAIPMQIDECDAKGALIMKEGPKAAKGDGKFSAGDELVFMAADAGPAYSGAPPPGCAGAATLTLSDAKSGAKGYVLLAKCETPPPASPVSYVKFDFNTRMATTDYYRFGFEKKLAFFYDYMAMKKGPDILDRLKVRLTVGKFGISYTFNEEEHFEYNLIGYLSGPVRTVISSSNRYKLGAIFGTIPVPQTLYFYPRHVVLINVMDTSLNPAILGLDFNVAIGHDLILNQLKGDYRICTNTLPACSPMKDPIPPERIKQINAMDTVWGGFDGPDGALISYMVPDPRLPTKVHSIYINDDNASHPPEAFKGSSPLLAFNVVDWSKVKAGAYHLDFYHFFMDKYSPAEVERYARLIKQPLEVTAK